MKYTVFNKYLNVFRRIIMEHTHTHTHPHDHASGLSVDSAEEAIALLEYMLHHNQHHAEELHDLAHCFDDTSADLIHAAVDDLKQSNYKIEAALKMVKEGYSNVSL